MGCSVFWSDRDLELYGDVLIELATVTELKNNLFGWRLPTLKEIDELDKKTELIDDGDFHLKSSANELVFHKYGIFYTPVKKIIDSGRYYYGWASDEYKFNSMHIFTFGSTKIYHSPVYDRRVINQVVQCKNDKLCVRLVKDK